MIFDSHVHTKFSSDSKMTIEEALNSAEKEGVGIIITDHLDHNYYNLYPDSYENLDMDEYIREYTKNSCGSVLLGLEIGMDIRSHISEVNFQFASRIPDFALGSVHTIGDMDIGARNIFEKYDRESYYRLYFNHMYECIKTNHFIDSLAHIDYPARYNTYATKSFYFREFPDELDAIYKYLAKSDKALELNLVRFNKENYDEFTENYKAFKDAGGKYVTIGSDSHGPGTIGNRIRDAVDFLNWIGLIPVYFKKRKIVYMK